MYYKHVLCNHWLGLNILNSAMILYQRGIISSNNYKIIVNFNYSFSLNYQIPGDFPT